MSFRVMIGFSMNIAVALLGAGTMAASCGSPDDVQGTAGAGGLTGSVGSGGGSGGTGAGGAAGSGATTTGTTGSTGSTGTGAPTGSTGSTGSGTTTGLGLGPFDLPELICKLPPFLCPSCPPESLQIIDLSAYIGNVAGQVVQVDLTTCDATPFGQLPDPDTTADGLMLGMAADDAGNVFVGFGLSPDGQKDGIYKLPPGGGEVSTPWAADVLMSYPNGLLLDGTDLYVTDSLGFIFRIDTGTGAVSLWQFDPLLEPDASACGGVQYAFEPAGANGIVRIKDTLYVSNTTQGSVVQIPILQGGTAGTPSTLVGPDCNLAGIDGLAVYPGEDSLLGVVGPESKLVRIYLDGTVEKLNPGALDGPTSIVMHKGNAFILNSAIFNQVAPAPGIVAYTPP